MERFVDPFWSRVDILSEDECWQWQGALDWGGYGTLTYRGRTKAAHRIAWTLAVGPIPQGEGYHGTCVLHSCDNRCCCNPKHLRLGTNADNVADRVARGRGRTTEETKLKIGLANTGRPQSDETRTKRSRSLQEYWKLKRGY